MELTNDLAVVERAWVSPVQTYAPPVHHPAPLGAHGNQHAVSTPCSVASPSNHDSHPTSSHLQQWQQQQPSQPSNGSNPNQQAARQLVQQRHELRHNLKLGPERLGLGFLLDSSQRVNRIQNGANGAQDSPQYHHLPMKHDWTSASQERVTRSRSASWESQPKPAHIGHDQQHQGHLSHSLHSASTPESTHSPVPSPGISAGPTPVPPRSDTNMGDCSVPIKNCAPTCPLDSLLLDFLSERRQRAADGLPAHDVIGPRYPSVSSLLNPANSAYSHPLSKVFTDILATFPDISSLPERVAVLYIMFLVMRWQIAPTQENYDRLPDWMTPLPSQIYTSHATWIDHVPFPKMRDYLVRNFDPVQFSFDDFFVPFTTTLSLSWPYEGTDTLLQSPDGDELMINPVFERHLRNLDNWKLGDAFAKAFPALLDTFNLDSRISRPTSAGGC